MGFGALFSDGIPKDSDYTIMECHYQKPVRQEDGTYSQDFLSIVYKNNETGIKYHEIIPEPSYTFYKTKEGIVLDHNYFFIEKDKVEPVNVKYKDILKEIAIVTGNYEFYKHNASTDYRENMKLHMVKEIFNSDMQIEDFYRLLFSEKFTNNIKKISKAFFDIEVDTRYISGSFVEMGEAPINAIAFHDETHDEIHSFLLRDDRNPQIEEFERSINSGELSTNEIRSFITDNIGGYKQLIRFKLDKTEIKFHFYNKEDEIYLLRDFFKLVHEYKPDFIEGWNSSAFDLEYIINRIYALGYQPVDIMTDETWAWGVVNNYVDKRNLSNFAERGDSTFISGDTVWIDQLIQFASKGKAQYGSFDSFKLDDIGLKVAKVKKLDYSHITNDIAMLPWLDYKTFVFYNIFDVIVQKCIELKSQDLEYLFTKCVVSNTSYKKAHRQTVYLINKMNKEFRKMGYIIGNNVNKWNEKPDKFLGALVNDPLKITEYAKLKINGIPLLLFDNLQDFDYKSLYPSITLENNIAPNTQLGKIVIPEKVYENENRYFLDRYSRGGEFIENLVCDNHIEFCKRWLHLAGFKEFLEDVKEYYTTFIPCYSSNSIYDTYYIHDNIGYVVPMRHCSKKVITPISFHSNNKINPIRFLINRPDGIIKERVYE